MARDIDLSKPLSDDEVQYLKDRDRLDDLRANAEAVGQSAPSPSDGNPQAQSARLGDQTTQQVPDGANPAPASLGQRQRADAAIQIKVANDETGPYEDWYKADLQDQARRRGLRDNGNKQDLVDRIEEWDAENLDEDGNVVIQVSDATDGDPDREPGPAEYTGFGADDGDPDEGDDDGAPDEGDEADEADEADDSSQ